LQRHEFETVSAEAQAALTKAFSHFAGSDFTALVTVYKPLKGEARITEIRKAYEL
jgi:hypothetical protein